MSYNPQSAVNAIYKLKGEMEKADTAGNEDKKKNIAAEAQGYYNELRNNGYSNAADQLASSNYTTAKAINDKWTTMGKTKTRDYLYSLGQKYGMSSSDVDNIIDWNNVTGQVSLGGKVIGTPDAVVDGVSYWSDSSVLDNAFNDYIKRSGTTGTIDELYKQTMQNNINKNDEQWATMQQNTKNLLAQYNQEYEDLKNTNPFETETAKSILAKYDLAGLQSRDNAVATTTGSNGGNIDSYAAANALRQQSALINQGQQVVLNEYQQRLDNAQNILNNLGIQMSRDYSDQNMNIQTGNAQAQQLFDNSETAKNNDTARKSEIASVTGYTPDEWIVSNNPYLNDDGTIKSEYKDVDFSAVMANAKAAGNKNAYNEAAVARYYKIMGNYGRYGKYDDGNYITPGQQQTETGRQFDAQIAASDRALQVEKDINTANNQNNIDQITAASNTNAVSKPTLTANQATTAIKNGEISPTVIDAYNYHHGTNYTVNNPPEIGVVDDALEPEETDYQVKLDTVYNNSSKTVKAYIRNVLEPLITENTVTESELKKHLLDNSKEYDLEINDMKAICTALGVDNKWVDNYKNSGLFGWGSGVKEK